MAKFFLLIFNWASGQRFLFFSIVLGITVLLAVLASRLEFEEDVSKMMPVDNEMQEFSEVLQNAKFKDKLIINIYLKDSMAQADPDRIIAFATHLKDSLASNFHPKYIREITEVSDEAIRGLYDLFYQHLPIFLEPEDYEHLEEKLAEERIDAALKAGYKSLVSPASFALKEYIVKDPLNFTPLVLEKLKSLQVENNFETRDGFIITKDHRNILLITMLSNPANETSENGKMLEGLDSLFENLSAEYDHEITAEYFGAAAMAVGNAKRIKKDIILTVSLALIILIIFIGYFFRKKTIFLLIFLPTLFGGLFSLAMLYLLLGKVSVIALGVGSILLGITIDYPLHIFTHFRKEGAVNQVITDLSAPVLTSCLTTAAAFLCLIFLEAEALNNLGLFVAFSIIGAALFSLMVLPQLLVKGRGNEADKPQIFRPTFIDRLAAINYDKKKPVLAIIAIFSIMCLFTFTKIDFEADLTNMNYVSDRLEQAEKNLNRINQFSLKSVFLISKGESLNEALRNNEQLSKEINKLLDENVIEKFSGISSLLPSTSLQEERIARWNNFWSQEKKQVLKEQLISLGREYKFKETAFSPFYDMLNKDFEPVPLSELEELKKLFFSDYINEAEGQNTVMTILRVDEVRKPEVYDQFAGVDDLIVFDNKLLTERFMVILKDDFNLLVKLSLLIVFLILIHSFGRIELGLITFIPMAVSWLWMLGIMGFLGIKFNMFNLIISSFIFGLGIDYSIFVSRGFLQEYKYGIRNIDIYKTSILLSVVTTLAGIGVLIFAQHPALKSIALMSIIGIISVLIVTFTVQPLLLKMFVAYRGNRTYPVTLGVFCKTFVTWGLLLIGCIVVILCGVVLFTVSPFSAKKRKALFHKCFMYSTWAYIKATFPFNHKIYNETNEDFKKPGIIICNHQSLIDTPLMLMQAPKLIMLTNDWVRNSPHFGPISRFGDFYSVSSGIDSIIGKLEEMVNDGYSIIVFPEGTRSPDQKIHRFHKGAFYLAEKLNLDIIPMLFHGTGDFLGKNDFWGRSNYVTVKILPRIAPGDMHYGENYSKRAKGMRKFMIGKYDEFRKECETAAYVRKKVIGNYIYKGPILEWYVKIKLSLENNYEFIHERVPQQGEIMDIGCGYGYMTFMLSLRSDDRWITGLDYDEEKIEVADNCSLKNDKIKFICANVLDYEFEKKDAFILSDVLHYLKRNDQKILLNKCFEKLKENGTIIIRDADAAMGKRQTGTWLTELISTKFGFNKTTNPLEFLSSKEIIEFAEEKGFQAELLDDSKFTSNVFIIIRR